MKTNVKALTLTAVLMAMNIALSSFGITVPGGHLYLNDVVIVVAALILNPFEAFLVGGLGAFLGDLFFYPTPMFVSLVTHGLQAVVISYLSHKYAVLGNKTYWGSAIAGAFIMVIGYTLGRTFVYSNWETAMLKLPFQIFQAGVGVVAGVIITEKVKLKEYVEKHIY